MLLKRCPAHGAQGDTPVMEGGTGSESPRPGMADGLRLQSILPPIDGPIHQSVNCVPAIDTNRKVIRSESSRLNSSFDLNGRET